MDLMLYRFFMPRAVTRSFKTEWDETAGCCISQNDVQMNEVHKADARFHFKCEVDTSALSGRKAKDDNNSNIQRAADADNAAPPPVQYQHGKLDSISTFRTYAEHASNANKKHPPRHSSNTTQKSTRTQTPPQHRAAPTLTPTPWSHRAKTDDGSDTHTKPPEYPSLPLLPNPVDPPLLPLPNQLPRSNRMFRRSNHPWTA
ncbi:hypothetical protein ACA910_017076 [Epithemia clementina (nom. ined.)]